MSKWVFFGRAVPERIPLTIRPAIGQSCEVADLGLKFDLSFGIADGQIVATLTLTEGNADVHTLRNLAEANIRSAIDVVGYLEGLSYDVDMISAASLDTGDQVVFGIRIPVLQAARGDHPSEIKGEFLVAIGQNITAQMVLADFREAIRTPVGTGFFCYRAIEAMRQSMKLDDAEDDGSSWQRLRHALCVDRSAIDYVKLHADFPRHGRPSAISNEQRANVFKITNEIIRRFFEYLMGGNKPLPAKDFPIFAFRREATKPENEKRG